MSGLVGAIFGAVVTVWFGAELARRRTADAELFSRFWAYSRAIRELPNDESAHGCRKVQDAIDGLIAAGIMAGIDSRICYVVGGSYLRLFSWPDYRETRKDLVVEDANNWAITFALVASGVPRFRRRGRWAPDFLKCQLVRAAGLEGLPFQI